MFIFLCHVTIVTLILFWFLIILCFSKDLFILIQLIHFSKNILLDVDECQMSKAGCDYRCQNTLGGFSCVCPAGQRLHIDGKSCIREFANTKLFNVNFNACQAGTKKRQWNRIQAVPFEAMGCSNSLTWPWCRSEYLFLYFDYAEASPENSFSKNARVILQMCIYITL